MKKWVTVILISFYFLFPITVHGEENQAVAQDFDIDLSGYELHTIGTFNQPGGKITPRSQLFFHILERKQEWLDEPRFYTKDKKGYVHLWKKDGTNVLYHVTKKPTGMWEIIDIKRKKIDRIPVSKTHLKEILIEQLVDPISKAIEEHYEPKLWYRGLEKITAIKKVETDNVFYVTVQVQTFEGAHNPPYGEETITFRIKGDEISVTEYKHRDIPEEEWSKLKLR
ncbi:DUF3888 domain-containing protein [Ornithinibacillus halophilus]|uniref:DUF3888 domain-containing protein n=1 Tax=Ornithinibacillus halophilus TaxID=930117 RepID=A0A1M5FVI5_9BACI|nr:DUF3888 domain-containing protein [Ornithinibacillus halophilus]SHF95560.1 Protein of unknown function [Ornithinibacillus halophilus]